MHSEYRQEASLQYEDGQSTRMSNSPATHNRAFSQHGQVLAFENEGSHIRKKKHCVLIVQTH